MSNHLTHFVISIGNNAGDHSGEVIPVPIPNTEVKLSYADDTDIWWESRKMTGFFFFIFISIFAVTF